MRLAILFFLAPSLMAAEGKWRLVKIERVFTNEVKTAQVSVQEKGKLESFRAPGKLRAIRSEDVYSLAPSLEAIGDSLKPLCKESYEAPLEILMKRPAGGDSGLGLGLYLPMVASYKVDAPTKIEFFYIAPGADELDRGTLKCQGDAK